MLELIAENGTLRTLLLLLLFIGVAVASYMSTRAVGTRQLTRRRLLEAGATGGGGTATLASLRTDRVQSSWLKLVNAIEKRGLSLVDTKDKAVRQRLIAAGFTTPHAPRVYTLIRLILVIGLPVLVLILYWVGGSSPGVIKLYASLIFASVIGLYLPSLIVRARADRRQRDIINGFPDALDLMLVCVEAGLGLEAAFARVGMEITTSHPRLAEQLGAVVLELRAGRSHEDLGRAESQPGDGEGEGAFHPRDRRRGLRGGGF